MSRLSSVDKVTSALEFILIAIAIPINLDRMAHFTWWGLAAYGVYAFLYVVSPRDAVRVWAVCFTLSTIIVGGVLVLSASRCNMLHDTRVDIGGSAYIMGNFAVHYWPWLRLYFHGHSALKMDVREFGRQAVYAFTLPVVYQASTSTSSAYGCSLPDNLVSAASVAMIVAAITAWRFSPASPSHAPQSLFQR
jgi:hypothetical protein